MDFVQKGENQKERCAGKFTFCGSSNLFLKVFVLLPVKEKIFELFAQNPSGDFAKTAAEK